MPTIDIIREESTGWLTATFLDKDGVAAVPSTVRYRVDCKTSGTAVRGWASVTPASSVEITLTPSDSAIHDATQEFEEHVVTVEATFGVDDEANAEYTYHVKNLDYVS